MVSVPSHALLRSFADTVRAYEKCVRVFGGSRRVQPHSRSKNLLLLAWDFPPNITGGVYRPISIIRGAVRRGWTVKIICSHASGTSSPAGVHLERQIADQCEIIRLPPSALHPSYKLFIPKIDGGFLNLLETVDLACKTLINDQPSVILASGPPFHNFVVARELAKRFQKPFVLDYRDEWTQCPFDFVQAGNLDLYFEKKCMLDARRVLFTTESHFRHQEKTFCFLDAAKVTVIPNGWEPQDTRYDGVRNPLDGVRMRLAFLGHLGEHTLPGPFLKSLESFLNKSPDLLDQFRIAFVGSKSSSAIENLNAFKFQNLVERLDTVPKPVALKIMRDAAGLLLINEPRLHRYRPGKLYDYVAMRTPILVYGGGGEIEDLVTRLKVGIVVRTHDPDELGNALLRLDSTRAACRSAEVERWISSHTSTALAESVVNVLEAVEKENRATP